MASKMLRFDGRVAVVTGAGGGLGRQYALQLAERGASVVVNDLGGSRSGTGKSSSAADQVVNEIRKKGGKAVPDYNSVEEGDKIIQTAIKNYGRIDILINNAGILRDKSFLKITDDDWDLVHRVHLRGSFVVTRAAWPYFRKQQYGRVIMTSSGAGIYGNFGQSNYSAAKLGLVGLSNTLAIEGSKYNIHCNTIIPIAASRLTEDVLPKELFDQLRPEYVSPVVVWLCHESCLENGGIIEAAGGWVGRYVWQRSLGKSFAKPTDTLTPEAVRDEWHTIRNMTDGQTPATVHEQMGLLIEALSDPGKQARKAVPVPSIPKEAGTYTYGPDELILYALGVGATTRDPGNLRFLYEGSEDFSALPTFGVIPAMSAIFEASTLTDEAQKMGIQVDPTRMLHGEQYLEIIKPLPTQGTFHSQLKLADILDKGSGAVIIGDVDTFNDKGQKVLYSQWTLFVTGAGNFGGKRTSDKAKPVIAHPQREPDFVIEEKTSTDQSALYRLCGDKNPMHIDPSFAAIGGFDRPIIHGLCTLGFAGRQILRQYAGNDPSKFKVIKTRFSNPLIPGDTLRTEMWKEGNRVYFQCSSLESGKPVLTGGYVDLTGIDAHESQQPSRVSPPVDNGLKSNKIFKIFTEKLESHPDLPSQVQAIYEWQVLQNGKPAAQWTLDLKNGNGALYQGTCKDGKPGCILTLEDEDLVKMAMGKLDAQKAFMSGKLKIRGNVLLAQKLQPLLEAERERSGPLEKSIDGDNGNDGKGQSSPPPSARKAKSDAIFEALSTKITKKPDLVDTVKTIYGWNITKEGKVVSEWTIDLKNDKGSVYRGSCKTGKADCILTLDDDDAMKLFNGKLDAQKAFMSGKLKIRGNVLSAQKLQNLWSQESSVIQDAVKKDSLSETDSSTAAPSNCLEPEKCTGLKCDFIFSIFQRRMHEEPELIKKVRIIFHFLIMKNGKLSTEWTVDTKSTELGEIYRGPPKSGRPDCTVTIDDDDVIKMMTGKLNPQRAFMMGKLKIKGNIMITQKLNNLWQEVQKTGKTPELPMIARILQDPMIPGLKSEYLFLEMVQRLIRLPDLHKEVPKSVEWNITDKGKPVSKWTLDLKTGKGVIHRGAPKTGEPDVVVTVEDEDFALLFAGRFNTKQFVSSGRAKIQGDANDLLKLQGLFKMYAKM